MENKTPVIQNERGHTLTEEQIEILKHIKHSNEDLKIKAFAGTGKTSTLRTIAEFTQKINYIYMAYNKAIQVEAQSTFPANVSCKTAHSLAYSALSIWKSSYKEKLANKIKFTEYLDAISYKHSFDKFVFFQDLVYCQRMFENSSDSEFLAKHIPSSCAHKNADYHLMLLEYAKKLWKLKIDRSNKIPIDHDTYLKLWQLQNPVINTDCIFFDECQDASPVMLDIVLKQKCRKIFVGDEHQQIYSWRGAINAMKKIEAKDAYLTKSFRFGNEIASLAQHILNFKGETKILRGIDTIQSKINMDFNDNEKHTVLSRTNMEIIFEAIECKTRKIHIIGGVENLIRTASSAYALYQNNKKEVTEPSIKIYDSWEELTAMADFDRELLMVTKLINNFKSKLPKALNDLRKFASYNEEESDLIFSTMHKAKGLEWDQVRLTEDSAQIIEAYANFKNGELHYLNLVEEFNLLYVAITRAKLNLLISDHLVEFLQNPEKYYQERYKDSEEKEEIEIKKPTPKKIKEKKEKETINKLDSLEI